MLFVVRVVIVVVVLLLLLLLVIVIVFVVDLLLLFCKKCMGGNRCQSVGLNPSLLADHLGRSVKWSPTCSLKKFN